MLGVVVVMVVVVVVVDVRRSIALARTRLASENQKPSCSESRFWMSASSFGLLRALVVLRPGPRPAPSVMTCLLYTSPSPRDS